MNFNSELNLFFQQLSAELEKNQIIIENHWQIDHLCYRSSTNEEYISLKKEFESLGFLLIESEVNGRLIATYKLTQPVYYKNWMIDVVEIPAPKENKVTKSGFEHIEIVCDISLEEIESRFSKCIFNKSGLSKTINAELEVELNNCAIKFHNMSLESLIQLEKNKEIFSALMTSGVLEHFKSFTPLVVGTFPLNLETQHSDIDIILSSVNLNQLENSIIEFCSKFLDFKFSKTLIQNEITLLINFTFQNKAFELFAQSNHSIDQNAFRHFFIEERLLKIGGPSFKEKIMSFRNSGHKTEPSFCLALGLSSDDSYNYLLELQNKSEQELKVLFK